jgi:hypothetical protein
LERETKVPAYAASWTFPAGPAEPTKGGGIAFPMNAEAYRGFAEKVASEAFFGRLARIDRTPYRSLALAHEHLAGSEYGYS